MENRLTYWNEEFEVWSYHGASGDAALALKAYEDTGLSPEEILQLDKSDTSKEEWVIKYYNRAKEAEDKLKSLRAEKNSVNLLLQEIGNTVYFISQRFPENFEIKKRDIKSIQFYKDKVQIHFKDDVVYGFKNIFKTYEAAQNKLLEMRGK